MNPPSTSLAAQGLTAPARRDAPQLVQRDPNDLSIGTGIFTQGIPAFWFARAIGEGMNNMFSPYADSAWVMRAIKTIAGPIASCTIHFSRPTQQQTRRASRKLKRLSTARGIVYRAPEELIDLPQISAFLKEPVKELTYFDFIEGSIGFLKLRECFWVLSGESRLPFPDVSMNPYAPIRMPNPDRMRPTVEDDEIVKWTFTSPMGKSMEIDPADVVRLRYWNPNSEHMGLGEYRAAHIAAEADWLAGNFSRNLMANNGDTSRIIAVKGGQPNDEQREQLIKQFRERRMASIRGEAKDVVVGGDVELHNAELAAVDESFIGQRLEHRHEVYIALGVPPSMGDIKQNYSIGSASDMYQLLINTCIPTGSKFCGALEKLIYLLTKERVEVGLNWDEHPSMQAVRQERLANVQALASQGMPMEQISDYLLLDLPAYPEWQQGYLPISVTPVSAAQNEAAQEVPEPTEQDFNEGPEKDEQDRDVKAMLELLETSNIQHSTSNIQRTANEELWRKHMRLRGKSVKLYQSNCSKVFNDFRAIALKHLHAAMQKNLNGDRQDACPTVQRSLLDVIFNPHQFSVTLNKSLGPVAEATLASSVSELMDEIGKTDDPWTMPPSEAKKFIESRKGLINGVSDTVRDQINTQLKEGLEKGEGMEEMSDRVRGVFNNLSKYEAKRIAMTEVSAAYGFARDKAMTAAGVTHKCWLSSHGPNVRPAHAEAEADYGPGKGIPMDEPFEVDGEDLMYPGDPSGSPGNVINCQCIQLAAKEPKE